MASDLFSDSLEARFHEYAPLAARMRPRSLEEFVGQSHLLKGGSPLKVLIDQGSLTSLILWGPPGSGKTSLARVIAASTEARFVELSAVSATVADVRRTITEARDALAGTGRSTIVFIDEVHRFNKGQQDALLPAVENRWIALIGATTENPYFELISPLMSRCLLVKLEPLDADQVMEILRRALSDSERGLGGAGIDVSSEAMEHIVMTSGGDARSALNALEACVAGAASIGKRSVTLEIAKDALQRRQVRYDKTGDQHYDVASAFIKSMRGSDPDAALWWLARMLEAGEDPRFIARRIVIAASEDVGNADPMALVVAVTAAHALELVGLPEAGLNLAHAVTYVASAPKSNAAAVGIWEATEHVKKSGDAQVPLHLRKVFPAVGSAHGDRYRNPHDYPEGWVEQQYRPDGVDPRRYYRPVERGYEAVIRERLERRGIESQQKSDQVRAGKEVRRSRPPSGSRS
ncbi:MAG: replication-associated recombination protein A [Actinomycetota bacterium]|nr:replication-associated recombination protein A [Actinomycetota bacterium]